MIRNLKSVGLVLVLLGIFGGCQAMTGLTTGENIDDTTLTSSVKTALAKDKASSLTRVDVDSVKGVVTLTGVVPTAADKTRAVEISRGVNGVKKVNDNLQVQKK
jgi:hyperosmotically inducible periplasmic protein